MTKLNDAETPGLNIMPIGDWIQKSASQKRYSWYLNSKGMTYPKLDAKRVMAAASYAVVFFPDQTRAAENVVRVSKAE